MAKRKHLFDSILCVDIEATAWDNKTSQGASFNEIIEFGICSIDLMNKTVIPGISYYVKPTTSTLSDFCVSLTKITPEILEGNGYPFLQVCHRIMEDYNARQRCWISWGNYDYTQTQRQCARENVPYPFGDTHWNMKDLYSVQRGLKEGLGLSKALAREGMTFIGQPHSGRDDATNVARLFAKLVLQWEDV